MKAPLSIGLTLLASTGCGGEIDAGEQPRELTQAFATGSCTAQGSGSAGRDISFAFELGVFPVRSASFSTSSGALTDAVVTGGLCAPVRGGKQVQLLGTGTWAGAAGHAFMLLATDDSRRPPTAGHSFDSVSLRVVSPTGEDVLSEGGSLHSGGVTVDLQPSDPSRRSCTVDVPGLSVGAHERLSLSVDDDPMVQGSVSYRRTGGGPPSGFEGPAAEMLCRQDGVLIADARGFGTFNGVEGYSWSFNAEERTTDNLRLSIWNISGARVFFVEQQVDDAELDVVFPLL